MSLRRMKIDIQQAIANGILEYSANYNSLIFNEELKEYQGFFHFAKEVKINIVDEKLHFRIKLDENIINKFSKEEMDKIKECDFKIRIQDLLIQQFVAEHLGGNLDNLEEHCFSEDLVNAIFKGVDEEENYREINTTDKIKLRAVKEVFENDYNLDFRMYDGESFAYLELVKDEIILNKKVLNSILQSLEILDTFIIAPQFDEESEEAKGVRLFFGIDLSVKEE